MIGLGKSELDLQEVSNKELVKSMQNVIAKMGYLGNQIAFQQKDLELMKLTKALIQKEIVVRDIKFNGGRK